MISLAVLIALALEIFLPDPSRYRPSEVLESTISWLRSRFQSSDFWMGWPGVLVTLAVAPIVVGIVADWLDGDGWLVRLLLLGLSAAVLVWCLRARDQWEAVRAYLRLNPDVEEEELRSQVHAILGKDPEGDRATWPDQIMTTLLSQATDRLFAPLFWFVVLGPVGAVVFISAKMLRDEIQADADAHADVKNLDDAGEIDTQEQEFAQAAETAYQILVWLPLRALVLAYSLVGSFTDTLEGWRAHELRCVGFVKDAQAALAVCAGFGALSMEPPWTRSEDAPQPHVSEVEAVLGLIQRALVVWVAAIVVLWIAGAF